MATEHAASESPATIGKANWAGKGLAGVSRVSPKEKKISWLILVTGWQFETTDPEAKAAEPLKV